VSAYHDVARCCSLLEYGLQCVLKSVLQCVAVCVGMSWPVTMSFVGCCSLVQCLAVCVSVCVAVYCSVRCSILQCDGVFGMSRSTTGSVRLSVCVYVCVYIVFYV